MKTIIYTGNRHRPFSVRGVNRDRIQVTPGEPLEVSDADAENLLQASFKQVYSGKRKVEAEPVKELEPEVPEDGTF